MHGPNGSAPFDKQLMLDDLCSLTVPGAEWLFSRIPDAVRSGAVNVTNGTAAGGSTRSSPTSWFPTVDSPLEPLDFTVPSGPALRDSSVRRMFDSSRRALRDAELDPNFLDNVMEGVMEDVNINTYSDALSDGLTRLVDQASAAAAALGTVANSPTLQRAGGENAVKAAQALQAGAETYELVLRAGRDSLKRQNQKDLANKTRQFLKDGGLTEAEKAFARRFRWRINFVRLAFRFANADGLLVTFQQWLFLQGDVDRIKANAKKLAAMDDAAKGKQGKNKNKGKNVNSINKNKARKLQAVDSDPTAEDRFEPTVATADGPMYDNAAAVPDIVNLAAPAASEPQLLPLDPDSAMDKLRAGKQQEPEEEEEEIRFDTGETPEEWFNRVVAESEASAKAALSRIPLESSTGLDRLL
ncbi:hypothetical protein PLESTM_000169900 [Pleodorina starrii]|nr:hypothetical protein PLESTM_000169900 [Pleodorina starrii]